MSLSEKKNWGWGWLGGDWLGLAWEQNPDGLRLTDRQGRILAVNEAYCRLAGLERQALISQLFTVVYPEEERAHALERYLEFVDQGQERPEVKRRWRTPAGRTIWVEALLRRVEVGQEPAVLAVFRDVTAGERLQQRLRRALRRERETRRRLRGILSSSSVGLGLLDAGGRVVAASESLCRMLGKRRGQVIGQRWEQLWECDAGSVGEPSLDDMRLGGRSCLCRPRSEAGVERIFVELTPLASNSGEEDASTAVVATDLTPLERFRRESSLVAAEASLLLREIANLTHGPARVGRDWDKTAIQFLELLARNHGADRACWYLYDFDGGLCIRGAEWAQPGMESPPDVPRQFPLDQFGKWVEKLMVGQYIEIEDVSRIEEPELREILERRGMKSVLAVPVVEGDRCTGWIALYGVRARRRFAPEVIEAVKVVAETAAGIQRLQKTRDELEESHRKLTVALEESERLRLAAEQASRAKSEFLATMSHEIRTPLNGVLGVLSLLEADPLPATTREHVQMARDSAHALLTLLNDLLDLARIEAGAMTMVKQDTDLLELMEQSLAAVAQPAAAKGLTLMSLVDARLPARIRTDPARLRQVLLNLIGNAVKFTERGRVLLQAGLAASEEPEICIRVRDTGPGIAWMEIDSIFEPFQQGCARDEGGRGVGLGLTLSRRLTELLGGQLEVVSEPGCGSEFSVRLPLPKWDATIAAASRPLAELQILVLDEQPWRREAICWQLAEWGATVRVEGLAADCCHAVLAGPGFGEMLAHILEACAARGSRKRPKIGLIVAMGADREAERLAMKLNAELFVEPLRWRRLLGWLRSDAAASSAAPALQLHESGQTVRNTRVPFVLIVDDNAVNRRVTSALLEKLGCRTETAASGEEALQRMAEGRPELVLLDLEMPGMSGLEVARRVREGQAEGVSPSLRLYALTAHVLPEEREKALAAGLNGFLAKPVSLEHLRQLVEECFAGTGPG